MRQQELDYKHEVMAADTFSFLRATFYRWAQLAPQALPDVAEGVRVLAVGDLHVETYGTWRDVEGRLVWGVSDFDEAIAVANDTRFGLASALSVAVLGDESGYTATLDQKMKIAAIEAMWDTEPPSASFTVFGIPDVETRVTRYKIELPWLLGLIATRSLDRPVEGINDLVRAGVGRIESGPRRLQGAAGSSPDASRCRGAGGFRGSCSVSRLRAPTEALYTGRGGR